MLNANCHRIFRLTALILCFLLNLSLPYAYATENSQSTEHSILILGDSISAGFGIDKSQGWVALLNQELKQAPASHPYHQAKIVNASISGETSSGGANRISKLLLKHSPNLVIIELGGNDGLRGTPIKLIKQNLSHIITQSKRAGASILLLGMRIPPNYGKTYSKLFSQQFQQLADHYKINHVPFFLQDVATIPGMMQADGIHPTEQAQPIMLNWVLSALK